MNDSLKTSLDRLRLIETAAGDVRDVAGTAALGAKGTQLGGSLLNKTGLATAGKVAGKAAKFVPYAGAAFSAADAVNRAQLGDTTGAALSGAGAIPFIGIPAIAAQAIRDKYNTGSWMPDDEEITKAYGTPTQPSVQTQPKTTPDAQPTTKPATVPTTKLKYDPKVKAIQDKILAKDPNALPKYGADGKLGPETQDAMKRFGITAESQNKGIAMHDSNKLSELKARLNYLEENNQQLDEGPVGSLFRRAGGRLLRRGGAGGAAGAAGTARRSAFDPQARARARARQRAPGGAAGAAQQRAPGGAAGAAQQRGAVRAATSIAARSPAGAARVLAAANNIPWLKRALQGLGILGGAMTAYELYKYLNPDEQEKLSDEPITTQPAGAGPEPDAGDDKPNAAKPSAADAATVASTDPTDVLGQDSQEKNFNSNQIQSLMLKAIDELNSLAKSLESENDPTSISLMGEYNGLLKRLEKAGFKPKLAESIEDVYKRLVIARSRKI
jgi:hypothetical protein